MSEWRYWVGDRLREVKEFVEDEWFDRSRNVHTAKNVSREDAGIPIAEYADSESYQPARPRHIRRAIAATSVRNFAEYVYVDLGSGKGRTLFIAAEFPFREVIGVELSRRLYEQSSDNIRSFRWRRRRSGPISAVHGDAKEFAFPDAKIVLYLFNPFGPSTTAAVLRNLDDSMRRHRRHVVVVLLWPRYSDLLVHMEGMRLHAQSPYYQIFETYGSAEEV